MSDSDAMFEIVPVKGGVWLVGVIYVDFEYVTYNTTWVHFNYTGLSILPQPHFSVLADRTGLAHNKRPRQPCSYNRCSECSC